MCLLLIGNLGLSLAGKEDAPAAEPVTELTERDHKLVSTITGAIQAREPVIVGEVRKDAAIGTKYVVEEIRASTKGLRESIDGLR